jgi:serine protease Do
MGDDRPENAPDGGVLVASVSEDTSASAAGIKEGDILVGWNGEDLADTKDMMTRLRSHKPGDVVRVRIWRDGKEETVEVTMRASKPKE